MPVCGYRIVVLVVIVFLNASMLRISVFGEVGFEKTGPSLVYARLFVYPDPHTN